MISDQQYSDWLDDDSARRVTLYNINCISGGTAVTRYLSNKPYAGGPATAPYLPVIGQDLEISQAITIDGSPQITLGELVVENFNGEFDSWFDDVFDNQAVQVLVGDITWPLSDFRVQFNGTLATIKPGSNENSIALQMRDIMQNLNYPILEDKLTNDVLYPVTFGEVPNITPVYDPATDRWYYNRSAAEGVIEVRTDGKPRVAGTEIIDTPASGYFKFSVAVGPGAVTASVQGDKTGGTYNNTIAPLIQLLVTSYGRTTSRLTTADIDTVNFAAFGTANPQPVGLMPEGRTNVLTACAQLAASKGAQMLPSRLGKLQLIQYAIPTVSTMDIPLSMQVNDAPLALVDIMPVKAAVSIAYCHNMTAQPSLQTSLPLDHKKLFADEWSTYTETDAAVKAAYQLTADPVNEETCLLTLADATVEAQRRLAIKKVPRKTYRVPLHPPGMVVQVGMAVKLFNPRYNMSAGKVGLVTKATLNFGTYRSLIEVTL
jgi:hypothetical protein